MQNEVEIKINEIRLGGLMGIPANAQGIVIFVHGSGSSRHSPRNKFVAEKLQENGFATLLFDLLTPSEDLDYMNRFNTDLLSKRLEFVTRWVQRNKYTQNLPIGYFGASTGAAAALVDAAGLKPDIKTVVSRGGRPDLTQDSTLAQVECPVLLIVGGDDDVVINFNKKAFQKIGSNIKELSIVEGATHLFEEPGKLDEVADMAVEWFKKFLAAQ